MKTIWLTRPDLRALCNGDPTLLECWLALHGRQEYQALNDGSLVGFLPALIRPATAAHPEVRPTLTQFQEFLWRTRPDLQQAFEIGEAEGQRAFIWWYFIHGIAELGLADLVTGEQKGFLNEPDPGVLQDASLPITRLMTELWRRSPDLQVSFPLDTPVGRMGFPDWYVLTVDLLRGWVLFSMN